MTFFKEALPTDTKGLSISSNHVEATNGSLSHVGNDSKCCRSITDD